VTWPARGGVVIALSCLLCAAIVIQGPSPHDAEAGPPRVAVAPHPAQRPHPASAVAARLDARIAAPWPRLQEPDGRFRDILGGGTRYGEAALGYALLQTGVRERAPTLIRTGLRGIDRALRAQRLHARQSVFENLSAAAAYDLARRALRGDPQFLRMRPRWRRFLATRRFKELDSGHSYDNHYLADAVATLELLRTGVRSPDPSAVVGNPSAALAGVEQLINVRVPAMAAQARETVHGARTLVLSDPPDNPLAYQGLSLGLYARAIALLGPRTTLVARRTLAEVARASWWLAAPDGDVASMGRSDEESWALAATAYGAAAAARLPATGRGRAGDLRALAVRTLTRLRGYGVGRDGLYITPAVGRAKARAARGLDSNAGGPSFTGVTLMMLNWALPELRGGAGGGRLGSDCDGGSALSVGPSRLVVVRRRDVWFAVKPTPTWGRPDDLRYGFGLLALKVRRHGRWNDVVPAAPQPGVAPSQPPTPSGPVGPSALPPPDSTGPVLLRSGAPDGFPYGDSMSIRRDGAVLVTGGWRDAAGVTLRTGVTFTFVPTDAGIRLSVPRRPRDRLQWSAFFPRVAPRRRPHGLDGAVAAVSWGGRARVRLLGGYASAVDPDVVRARITLAPGRGPARLGMNFARPNPSTSTGHA
jgi:hypothetical protein